MECGLNLKSCLFGIEALPRSRNCGPFPCSVCGNKMRLQALHSYCLVYEKVYGLSLKSMSIIELLEIFEFRMNFGKLELLFKAARYRKT